ncbi:aminodeoxychorismate synthase component I [Maribrevibacterium harenarium]|uniref:aminodeoxychorismate synthase n=1 Tax=Maribrevibacterium harenarium TaxID=2589817 RepID=A0A501X256_9GAMM|nr:aminodeoxychorismate synthase component I [Maribrevibacterium harenarium]TPE54554.1 aminodeoxychorismate synthase component I [Maribrevibacterium harenarium]
MSKIKLISLPYQPELAALFPNFAHLPFPIVFDSNHATFKETRFDILSAAPACTVHIEREDSGVTWHQSPLFQTKDGVAPLPLLEHIMQTMTTQEWAQEMDASLPFTGGLLGYYGYEVGRHVERLPQNVIEDVQVPELLMGLYTWALISDHEQQSTYLMITPWCVQDETELLSLVQQVPPSRQTEPFQLGTPFQANMTEMEYLSKFDRIQDYIRAGDCYQVNLAQRFSAPYQGETWAAYQALKQACPTPYSVYFKLDDRRAILSHSPERFLLCNDGYVESKPIKGTRPRGATPEQDQYYADQLMNSEKDRAENLMIVDLLRNDLGRTCVTGSVSVPKLFALESYPNVHHLVSTVSGRVNQRHDPIRVFHESFPGGSITGAPKVRSMEIIDELEPHQRSAYCGAFVYFSCNGQMDSNITIRTLVADGENIHCWAGGGIVADSVGLEEYQETFTKVGKLTHTLEDSFLR